MIFKIAFRQIDFRTSTHVNLRRDPTLEHVCMYVCMYELEDPTRSLRGAYSEPTTTAKPNNLPMALKSAFVV